MHVMHVHRLCMCTCMCMPAWYALTRVPHRALSPTLTVAPAQPLTPDAHSSQLTVHSSLVDPRPLLPLTPHLLPLPLTPTPDPPPKQVRLRQSMSTGELYVNEGDYTYHGHTMAVLTMAILWPYLLWLPSLWPYLLWLHLPPRGRAKYHT